jgi:hypothetical protein
MGRLLAILAVLAFALLAAAPPARAIPAFASRYGVECHFCHEGFPKLNTIGQRFKERGFRMEKEDDFDFDKWLRSVPAVVRASGAHVRSKPYGLPASNSNTLFLKGISAGNLGRRFSYWIDTGAIVTEGDDTFQYTNVDNGWGRLEVVGKGRLYVKGGRFELDLPFTQTRTPHLLGYDIYYANTGLETDNFGVFQEGVEVGGALPDDMRWSAAVVKGHNTEEELDLNSEAGRFEGNLYLRLSKRVMRHRFGAFAFIGRNTIVLGPSAAWRDNMVRLGGDANLWFHRLNIYGVGMYGRNDNSQGSLAQPMGTGEALSFSGGFLQADYHLRDFLALTVRGNLVSQPAGTTARRNDTFASVVPGIQIFTLGQHVKLSAEWSFPNRHQAQVGIVQLDLVL